VASGGYSTLDYGSDVTYENSVVGTPSKGSEGGLEMEMEALAVEDHSAILTASADPKESQQQESNNTNSEEVVAEMQNQAEFMDDVATDEVCLLAYMCTVYSACLLDKCMVLPTLSFVLENILSRSFDQEYFPLEWLDGFLSLGVCYCSCAFPFGLPEPKSLRVRYCARQ
jgi:hypothetical protein